MPTTRRRMHLLVIIAYILLSLLLTFPVISSPAALVPGSDTWAYDEYTFLWNIWWFKHSLLDLGTSPLHTQFTFYPVGTPLILYTYNFFNCMLALPVYLAGNLVLSSNFTLWLSLSLGGYACYILVRYLILKHIGVARGTATQLAPFLAGVAYAFSASRFVYLALGHYIMVTAPALPLFAFFVLRVFDEQVKWQRYALLAGFAFALSALAEMTFALFLGLFLVTYALFALRRVLWQQVLFQVAAILLASIVFYSPLLYAVVRETLVGNYSLVGWGDSLRLSVDLLGLFTPTALHPLSPDSWVPTLREVVNGSGRFADVNTFFLGYAAIALALIGMVAYRRRSQPWLVTVFLAVVLSLGPLLQIEGRYSFNLDGLKTTVPLPFILLHYIPVASAGRAPNRFSALALLSMSPLIGFGCFYILHLARRWWSKALIASLLTLALIWDGFSVPLPVTDASVPAFLRNELSQDSADYAVINLPFGLRNSFGTLGAERTQVQYYQTTHGKRFVGGNISRAPEITFDYYARIAPLAHLMAIESYQTPENMDLSEDKTQAAKLAALLDIRYLIVHAPVPGRLPYADTFDEAFAYASKVFRLQEVHRDPDGRVVVFSIAQAPIPDDLVIETGQASDNMYLGAGWSGNQGEYVDALTLGRWVEGREAVVYLPVNELSDYTLTIRAAPFAFSESPQQIMTVLVNGQAVETIPMQASWQDYAVSVPASLLHESTNTVQLRFAYAHRPADVIPGAYAIGTTGVQSASLLEVNSKEDLAYITIGEADASLHAAGFNIAIFDTNTGVVLLRRAFAADEHKDMARFLDSVRDGMGVVIAAKGEILQPLPGDLCQALQALGGTGCPESSAGYAFIGVKGAPSGTALEYSGAEAYIRIAPDNRALSAAVARIEFNKTP